MNARINITLFVSLVLLSGCSKKEATVGDPVPTPEPINKEEPKVPEAKDKEKEKERDDAGVWNFREVPRDAIVKARLAQRSRGNQ